MSEGLHRGGRIPEGAVIASVISVGTQQCRPFDAQECDSWKTFGLGIIRYLTTGEPIPVVHPLCKKHFHEYIDSVLFSNDTQWGNAAEELGIDDLSEDDE